MSKLYEALRRPGDTRLASTPIVRQGRGLRPSTRRQLELLYQALESSLHSAGRVVGFTA